MAARKLPAVVSVFLLLLLVQLSEAQQHGDPVEVRIGSGRLRGDRSTHFERSQPLQFARDNYCGL